MRKRIKNIFVVWENSNVNEIKMFIHFGSFVYFVTSHVFYGICKQQHGNLSILTAQLVVCRFTNCLPTTGNRANNYNYNSNSAET